MVADPRRGVLVWGLAVVAAVAVHACVLRMLWWPRVAAEPHAVVTVQLIERSQPAPAQTPSPAVGPVPQLPAAMEPKLRRRPPAKVADKRPALVKPKPAPQVESRPKPSFRDESRPDVEVPPPLLMHASTDSIHSPAMDSAPPRQTPALSAGVPPPAAGQRNEPELALQCPRRPPPRYPAAARRLGEEGVVELRVELSARGAVAHIAVARSSGSDRLDRAAVAAVRGWRCTPARVNGVAVPATAVQRIRFSLR